MSPGMSSPPCSLLPAGAAPPLPRSQAGLLLSLVVAGFAQGLTTPLVYELAAELLYPVKEGMSAGILVLLLNASCALLIVGNDLLPPDAMNEIMTATAAACFIAVGLGVREEYRRPVDAVAKRASRSVPAQVAARDARHEAVAAGEEPVQGQGKGVAAE